MAVIYQITNMVNGKYYIGSSTSFERRVWQHKNHLRRGEHKNPHLQAAWTKYGEEPFVFEVLETVPDDQQLLAEDRYLKDCVGKPECYNINTGAEVSRLGIPHTQASKDKVSKNRTGKHAGTEHYRYGQTVSEETRQKIGDTQRGVAKKPYIMSEQGRANITAAVRRGEDSHFYGKRPTNADDMQRAVRVIKVDRTEEVYPSLTYLRDKLGLSLATTIRACKSGKPVKFGAHAGWVMSYADAAPAVAPDIPEQYRSLPHTRQEAKALGAKFYFTGVPCERGHISERRTKGTCLACAREDYKKENDKRRKSE